MYDSVDPAVELNRTNYWSGFGCVGADENDTNNVGVLVRIRYADDCEKRCFFSGARRHATV